MWLCCKTLFTKTSGWPTGHSLWIPALDQSTPSPSPILSFLKKSGQGRTILTQNWEGAGIRSLKKLQEKKEKKHDTKKANQKYKLKQLWDIVNEYPD